MPPFSHLVSNSAVLIHDGVVLVPGLDEEVEQQRCVEPASGGKALDLQNSLQLSALELYFPFQGGHCDGPRILLARGGRRHAVPLDVKAETVIFRLKDRALHPWLDATLPHDYFPL